MRRQRSLVIILVIFIICLHIFLLFQTVFWPATEFRIYPYLTTKGLLPYKDFVDQHFPGVFSLPINLYSVGLATPGGLRAIQIAIVSISQILIFLLTKKISTKSTTAFFAMLLYLLLQVTFEGYVLWVDSFIAPLLLASAYLLLSKPQHTFRSGIPLLVSGIFLAIALSFKQQIVIIFSFVLV